MQAREALGMSQTALAAAVGMSQQRLSLLEKRDSETSTAATKLADQLGVSLRWLLTGDGQPTDSDRWPFPRVKRERWDACDEGDRGYIQAAINKALDECEALRATAAAPASSPRKPPPRLAA